LFPISSSGVNFINMLMGILYAHRSQKRKKTDGVTVIFALMGFVRVKAACKVLVKLTPALLQIPDVQRRQTIFREYQYLPSLSSTYTVKQLCSLNLVKYLYFKITKGIQVERIILRYYHHGFSTLFWVPFTLVICLMHDPPFLDQLFEAGKMV